MSKISLSYPDTGLTISISVKNRDTGVEAFSGTMTEVGTTKVYIYDFTEVVNTDYVYIATVTGYSDMSGTIYRDGGGLTIEQSTELSNIHNAPSPAGFAANINNTLNDLKKDIKKINTEEGVDKILGEIGIAKDSIINRIEVSENEVCKDIKKINKELQEDNVSTRQLVRQKTKKLDENLSKLSDRQELIDKTIEDEAEDLEEEIERILEEEADMVEQQIDEQLNKEADDIEQEINSN